MDTPLPSALLRLRAKDSEDIQVVSAVLQDAIAPIMDMTFRSAEGNFIMVVHRLKHETMTPGTAAVSGEKSGLERICCAVNIRGAKSVKTQGIDLKETTAMLDLLAILLEQDALHFVFAGGAQLKIQLNSDDVINPWSVLIEDFGDAWPATCNPCHDAALKDLER